MLKLSVFLTLLCVSFAASANTAGQEHPKQVKWHFDGVTGTFDRQSIQRGFQVYKEVCAACHSLSLLSYRNLQEVGFSEAEVKAIAAEKNVPDIPNDKGEIVERPARPSDRFVPPYPNENAARAANNGAYPPDLSLIVKARHDGANYIYSLLTGYGKPLPHGFQLGEGMNYNPYFPGGQIAMPAPLADGAVTYEDGTTASVDQMSRDVVNFLQWASEPEMEHRKAMGLKALGFLVIMTVFFYAAKVRIWKKLKQKG
jgi:ubiquinol-cytochrome c reductase cytochrome c1 subunit